MIATLLRAFIPHKVTVATVSGWGRDLIENMSAQVGLSAA